MGGQGMPIIRFILNPEKKSYKKGEREENRINFNWERKAEEMEFISTRSGMLNFIFILAFNCIILILTLETDPKLTRNILKFGYRINCKNEG